MVFCLPIDISRLQNERLWFVPFEQCTQANLEEFINETCIKHPEVWDMYPGGPFPSLEAYRAFVDKMIGTDPVSRAAVQFFAIYLKAGTVTRYRHRNKSKSNTTDPDSNNPATATATADGDDDDNDKVESFAVSHGTFAGTTGIIGASATQSKAEIGHVIVLPRFQRTFVNTHASCLILRHLLDPLDQGGLNLRRVSWTTSSENHASIRAAERLGMVSEGIVRWAMVMGDEKKCVTESDRNKTRAEGLPVVDKLGNRIGPGRHNAVFSLCWDDWRYDGKREHVLRLLART